MNVTFPSPPPLLYGPEMIWSWSGPTLSKYPMRSVCAQYLGAPKLPGEGHVCRTPPGSDCPTKVGTSWAVGRFAAEALTRHVPPRLSTVLKPCSVRNPPGVLFANRFLTAGLPFRRRSTIAF